MELGRRAVKIARFRCAAGTFTGCVLGPEGGEYVRPVGAGDDATVLSLAMAARCEAVGWLPPAAADEQPLASVGLLAPIGRPPSIRDFYAFEAHVATARGARGQDVDPVWYELPAFYLTNPAAVIGAGVAVVPPARTARLDFELEVAMVLGGAGRDLSPDGVAPLVAGYCIMNDWSARDLQQREMRLNLGPAKGKDFATSLGPWLVTPDEFTADPRGVPSADMSASVNGVPYSRANLADMWWSFAEMACYASETVDLVAGDVLASGTAGTGCILELAAVHGEQRYPWLQAGDEVTLAVRGLGTLTNPVAAAHGGGWRADPERARPARFAAAELK